MNLRFQLVENVREVELASTERSPETNRDVCFWTITSNLVALSILTFGVNAAMSELTPPPFSPADLNRFVERNKFSTGKSFHFLLADISRGDYKDLFDQRDYLILSKEAENNRTFKQKAIRQQTRITINSCRQFKDNSHYSAEDANEMNAKVMVSTFEQLDVVNHDAYAQRYQQTLAKLTEQGREVINHQLIPQIQSSGSSSTLNWRLFNQTDLLRFKHFFDQGCAEFGQLNKSTDLEFSEEVITDTSPQADGDQLKFELRSYGLKSKKDNN